MGIALVVFAFIHPACLCSLQRTIWVATWICASWIAILFAQINAFILYSSLTNPFLVNNTVHIPILSIMFFIAFFLLPVQDPIQNHILPLVVMLWSFLSSETFPRLLLFFLTNSFEDYRPTPSFLFNNVF